MNTPLLEIEDLHAKVAGKEIIKGFNLVINEGEVHAIMGPNGAGKSTLSYLLSGKPGYEITSGTVKFRGRDLMALPAARRRVSDYAVSGGNSGRAGDQLSQTCRQRRAQISRRAGIGYDGIYQNGA